MKRQLTLLQNIPRNTWMTIGVLIFAVVGTVLLVGSHAATPTISYELEVGTRTGNASIVSDSGASGGSAVKFKALGGFQANCITKPSDCGYPDATNTGVPAGTTLTNSGCVTVTTDNAVIQNLSITNCNITIKANNVTVKNTIIGGCTYYPIDYDGSKNSGLVVQDTEIASSCPDTTAGMSFSGYTAIRMNVHGTADGFKADGNATIQDSYIHDLAVTEASHNDGVQSTGGDNGVFRHNTCDTGTAGVCIQFGASNRNWLVTENLIHSTGWAINGGGNLTNSVFTNNRFARVSGWYGPASLGGSGNTWSGNYYDDTGAAAN